MGYPHFGKISMGYLRIPARKREGVPPPVNIIEYQYFTCFEFLYLTPLVLQGHIEHPEGLAIDLPFIIQSLSVCLFVSVFVSNLPVAIFAIIWWNVVHQQGLAEGWTLLKMVPIRSLFRPLLLQDLISKSHCSIFHGGQCLTIVFLLVFFK